MIDLRNIGWLSGACLGIVGFFAGCDEERQIEASVDAESGLSQPGAADGALLDEAEACAGYESALTEAKESLGCDELTLSACPSLIRPANSLACVQYTESSVQACVAVVSDFKRCSDFSRKACLLTAVADTNSEGCVRPGLIALTDGGPLDGGVNDSGAADSGTRPTVTLDAAATPGIDAAAIDAAAIDAAAGDASP